MIDNKRATAWGEWTNRGECAERAGGRRRYNAQRQFVARMRRHAVLAYMAANGITAEGRGTELARHFGVSRATMCRDLGWIWRLCCDAAPGVYRGNLA